MVDFIKVIYHNAGFLRDHECLETLFKREVNFKTGETNQFEKATFKNLEFKLYDSGLLILSGSLHKFYNQGQHNYNDFTFSQLRDTLLSIQNTFNLNLSKCGIQNIELGLNITPPVPSKEILDMMIIHKAKCFDRRFNGLMKEAVYDEYCCKFYDKAAQENLKYQCFRFEIKYIKSRKLQPLKITTLDHLLNEHWAGLTLQILMKQWENTLLFDPALKLGNRAKGVLHQWQNPLYWTSLTPTQRNRNRKYFEAEIQKCSTGLKAKLTNTIQRKWKHLSSN